uniref:Uncharacterized protein n=1 Tax=Arundo donax TaxID=35708 RepID=A0A0A9DXY6_ARUDO
MHRGNRIARTCAGATHGALLLSRETKMKHGTLLGQILHIILFCTYSVINCCIYGLNSVA